MKTYPIIFSTQMVEAILKGQKTMTRRVIYPQPSDSWMENIKSICPSMNMFSSNGEQNYWLSNPNGGEIKEPYGKPGDLMWVRESLYQNGELGLEYTAFNLPIDETIIPDDYGRSKIQSTIYHRKA
jgi:hypothetical protein